MTLSETRPEKDKYYILHERSRIGKFTEIKCTLEVFRSWRRGDWAVIA
jgi:hypothetical protein